MKPHTRPGLWHGLLGGSWDLATTSNWVYNPAYNWGNPCKASQGDCKWGSKPGCDYTQRVQYKIIKDLGPKSHNNHGL